MLLSREGWTCAEIGAAFGVTADSVRHWRSWYARGGVEALRAAVVPGPSGERGLRALSVAAAILSEPVENRPNWTIERLRAEIERRQRPPLSQHRPTLLPRGTGGHTGRGPPTPRP